MNDSNRRNRIIAIAVTLAAHIAVLVVMLCVYLKYTGDEPRKWPPVENSEILYGGQLVVMGDAQEQVNENDIEASSSSQQEMRDGADDISDKGTAGEEPALLTSDSESPARVKDKPVPEKQGPTKEELAEQERIKREQEAAERIKRQVRFGSTGEGQGRAGTPDGNSTVGATGGTPGHTLTGRTLESFGRPNSRYTGTIRIRVRVNREGYVIGTPTYDGGEGPASANSAVRRSCIAAARQSRFSVALDARAEQVGVITWRFE